MAKAAEALQPSLTLRTQYGGPYHYDMVPEGDSMTQQIFKEECDINNILARFDEQTLAEHNAANPGGYGDYFDVQDYHTSLSQVRKAEEMFASLPSKIREQFANDVGLFIDFVADEENRERMLELGLVGEASEASDDETGGAEPAPVSSPAPAENEPAE